MDYFHFIIAIVSVIFCYIFGAWQHWEKYYATILFFILGDLIYNIVFSKKLLWKYNSKALNHSLINLLVAFTVYPSTVLVYFAFYPDTLLFRVVYILIWTFAYTIVEYVGLKLKYFEHQYGWNTIATIIFNMGIFIILPLHQIKPPYAWTMSLVGLIFTLKLYEVNVLKLD
ncbi:CBO0543 family protein [Serpentinicella alkaliphila]|uniref:Uncharacterized protein n=1 Tax=Serpentinicella alkaliphila TaxID=1734049 RepID=A0A4R2TG46_9FIRM|nr:CBO0543 family protein [Serpentinicella alkaliphila]QUH25326.1 hypothetical protein HZR23_05780 [Serpentinicella alkaliphila]TCQ02388.1 hypothetical protein EDD79_101634 [Serpentinicella alkaliphila]